MTSHSLPHNHCASTLSAALFSCTIPRPHVHSFCCAQEQELAPTLASQPADATRAKIPQSSCSPLQPAPSEQTGRVPQAIARAIDVRGGVDAPRVEAPSARRPAPAPSSGDHRAAAVPTVPAAPAAAFHNRVVPPAVGSRLDGRLNASHGAPPSPSLTLLPAGAKGASAPSKGAPDSAAAYGTRHESHDEPVTRRGATDGAPPLWRRWVGLGFLRQRRGRVGLRRAKSSQRGSSLRSEEAIDAAAGAPAADGEATTEGALDAISSPVNPPITTPMKPLSASAVPAAYSVEEVCAYRTF